jgi:Ca2+/H+ antiporter, TMEM165/GDT1 family
MGHPFFELVLSTYAIVFVAELPDKTALAAVTLATRHRPWPVLLGTALALTVQSAVAVAAGRVVAFLPARVVHVVAGAAFIVAAVVMWLRKSDDQTRPDEAAKTGFWREASLVFGVVFVAEWGDLTQIATAALAARFAAPLAVFLGATAALWSVATIAVFVGNRAGKLLSPSTTQKAAAVVFALVGAALLMGLL